MPPSDYTPLLSGHRTSRYGDGEEDDERYDPIGGGLRRHRNPWFEVLQEVCQSPLGVACVTLLGVVLMVLFFLSFARISPLEYGLVQNSLTGKVDFATVYTGGLYFLGPFRSFLRFPATALLFEFSANRGAHSSPISCRTGRDLSDPDSGGQPIRLSVSLTYKLPQQHLGDLYRVYAMTYAARLEQFAWMVISDVTQQYEPAQFWNNREKITAHMRAELREELLRRGPVFLQSFQLLKIEFLDRYEQGIIGIQLAIQNRTTYEYEQQVVQVMKQIDVMESTATAAITAINAKAQAMAKLWRVNASCAGLNVTQSAKAEGYSGLRRAISTFDNNSLLLKFVKIKAIRNHNSKSLTVGVPTAPRSSLATPPRRSSLRSADAHRPMPTKFFTTASDTSAPEPEDTEHIRPEL